MNALLLAQVEEPHTSLTPQTRIIAAALAILFMAVILEFIRRHKLQERYSVIWLAAGLAMVAGAAYPKLLTFLADLMGVRDTNVALFSLLGLLLLALCFHFTVTISRQADQITRLAQERAIERARSSSPAARGRQTSRRGDPGEAGTTPRPAPGSASPDQE